MKRDDQILSLRLQSELNRDRLVQSAKDRDRALNYTNGEVPLPLDELQGDDGPTATAYADPSKVIVIHPGSQNLRIGFASDALPKTIPMVLATKYPQTESEMYEALPRRQFEARTTEQQYGEDWSKKYQKMCNDLKTDMRANRRKVLPNSKDLVLNFNRRTEAEVISTHNDPLQDAAGQHSTHGRLRSGRNQSQEDLALPQERASDARLHRCAGRVQRPKAGGLARHHPSQLASALSAKMAQGRGHATTSP